MRISENLRLRLLDHARRVMASREPDVRIGGDYLHRWMFWPKSDPRSKLANLYVHLFMADDDDRALHDHVCPNASIILDGGYDEHTHALPRGRIRRMAERNATIYSSPIAFPTVRSRRFPGEVVFRMPSTAHRLSLIDGRPSVSLFVNGPRVREWGFWCPKGWVDWRTYLGGDFGSREGGCL